MTSPLAPVPVSPLIVGLEGATLTPEYAHLMQRLNPAGYILMGRNCQGEAQIQKLIADLKKFTPHSNPIVMVDQEFGRVRRVRFGDHDTPPPADVFGRLYGTSPEKAVEAARLAAFLDAAQLHDLGFNTNATPVADVKAEGMHDVIGDRAFSHDPRVVGALCGAVISGSLAGGIWPIIKHAPGHGRAVCDSHHELPTVEASARDLRLKDFIPFQLNKACPFVMLAHICYTALDRANPATHSAQVHKVLREALGMTGLIMGDDIGMEALTGTPFERVEKSLLAGSDFALLCFTDPGAGAGAWTKEAPSVIESLLGAFKVSAETQKRWQTLPPLPKPDLGTIAEAKEKLMNILKDSI